MSLATISKTIFAAVVVIGASTSIANAETTAQPTYSQSTQSQTSFKLAQACGWYAIGTCSRRPRQARRSVNRHGGRVIWTNNVGNFRPGWFCQVVGPTSRSNANSNRRYFRGRGIRSAYIKYGC